MRCNYCDAEISYKLIRCPVCGRNQQMVPDYNPLDDLLSEQIKIEETAKMGTQVQDKTVPAGSRTKSSASQSKRTSSGNTGRGEKRSSTRPQRNRRPLTEREKRLRKQKRMRELRRRRRRLILFLVLVFLVICSSIGIGAYTFSYSGIVNQGYRSVAGGNYDLAKTKFERAISKNSSRPEAYTGMADLYLAQGKDSKAESVFTKLIENDQANDKIYDAMIRFYIKTEQQDKIPAVLSGVDSAILSKLSSYVVNEPVYSLDAGQEYDEVQLVSLTADEGCTIHYTTDGKAPTSKSKEYKEPILLEEGITNISAVAVDERGIPSQAASESYTVELPIEDAPAVSPSTGQYKTDQKIEIKVPEGYTAYYTTDGSDPTSASLLYYDAIDMPEGSTIFKAILVSASGKASGVTTRNYVLGK